MYQLLKEEKIDITFSCLGRIDAVNPEILAMLKKWVVGKLIMDVKVVLKEF